MGNLNNLNTLYLDNNQISDLTPIRELNNLNALFLNNNQVSDLTPVKKMSLVRVELKSNLIRDFGDRRNLPRICEGCSIAEQQNYSGD